MSTQLATCSKCGASIIWAPTERGKKMPLDAAPIASGNIVLGKLVDGRTVVRYVTPYNVEDYRDERTRYTSHLDTCPRREKWRRRD